MNASPADSTPAINILWTGGWDSSYRVLHLAIVARVPVAPVYFRSPWRQTTKHELAAIRDILAALKKTRPEAAALIRPLRVFDMDSNRDPADPFLTDHDHLRRNVKIGSQYALIARELQKLDLDEVEMCIHLGPQPARPDELRSLFHQRLERTRVHGVEHWKLSSSPTPDAVSRIFSRCRFPLYDVTKLQTRELARQHGFEPLLHHTWFCHHPRADQPCGVCTPCRQAVADGFGWRVGLVGHLRAWTREIMPVSSHVTSGSVI
jgi:hypothetical protein